MRIGAETRLVGLLGDPVSHSLSPLMQNAAFAARALDWAYVALRVEPEGLEAAIAGLSALGFAGANVTIPHKTPVVAFCDELDPVAERAGSVNTLVVRDGSVHGSSTDGLAVTEAVATRGEHVLVLGAGGGAQAVATALLDAGAASLRVASRSEERAGGLVSRLRSLFPSTRVEAAESWPPERGDASVLVNATPILDEVVLDPAGLRAVVDLAYRPDAGATALVEAARAAGAETADGLEVLVRQGAASFERWTGVPAPVDVMRSVLRRDG
ncbi:MAG TPA: shikimate dehydrogenase [Gaiellaceae bacterium]